MNHYKNNFLLELYFEEIPENLLEKMYIDFLSIFKNKLNTNYIKFYKIEKFLTNRRLGILVKNINYNKYNNFIFIKGPNINNLSKYIFNKWCKKNNLNKYNVKYVISDKGLWLYFLKYYNKSIKNLLFNISKESINDIFKLYGYMKWNNINNSFIRPLRSIILLLNNKIIDGNIKGIKVSKILNLNRCLKKNKIILDNPIKYENLLKLGKVIPNILDRKNKIINEFKLLEKKLNGKIIIDNIKFKKILFSFEFPKILFIKIDKNLLINKNILIPIIYKYFNYLLIIDKFNNLIPYFIWVSNLYSIDYRSTLKNNKNYIISLLKDIIFLIKKDLRLNFFKRLSLLKKIIFRKELGNLYNKIIRVKNISFFVCKLLKINEFDNLKKLCFIYKCDLTTNIVKEFPLLNGIIGMNYSLINGFNKNLSLAIKEQYDFDFIKKNKSSNIFSFILSISDKIDNIVGNLYLYFLKYKFIKLENDPFFIKKDINFIIYLIINNKINISIFDLIKFSIKQYNIYNDNFLVLIKKIFIDRIKLFFINKGYSKKVLNLFINEKINNIYNLSIKISLSKNNEYKILVSTYNRIKKLLINILNIKIDIININKLSKIDSKFLNILNSIKHYKLNIFFEYNYNKLFYKLINLCNFINIFLNKCFIYKKNNEIDFNKVYLLKKSLFFLDIFLK